MSKADGTTPGDAPLESRTRIRVRALLLMSLALAFYFGFIALTFYRSHH